MPTQERAAAQTVAGANERLHQGLRPETVRGTERIRPWHFLNDQAKADIIRLLARGHSVRAAAKRNGHDPNTVYGWLETDPAFARAFNALAQDRDDEALEFRERVRRMAHSMLDEIEALATSTAVPARDRNVALRTFFDAVHNPLLAPRAPQGGPTVGVYIGAEQAALLLAPSGASLPVPTSEEA